MGCCIKDLCSHH